MSEHALMPPYKLYKPLSEREADITVHAGIYIHIPFCVKKCPYCDFYSTVDLSLKTAFITDLLKEIELRSNPALPVDTIYLGGGTPSLLNFKEVERIIIAVAKNFQLVATGNQNLNCENLHNSSENSDKNKTIQITIEVNPGTIKDGYLNEIRKLGVNRLSIGVQSFQDEKLAFLGRIHSADAARKTILSARDAGFKDISIDLIYGLPGETEKLWLSDLDAALEYLPEHISCYMLSYEPGTPVFSSYENGDITPLDDETTAYLFRLTSEHLVSRGFSHYEISNFAATSEHQSKHNKKYWEMVPYLGFGPSAHSYYCESASYNEQFKFNEPLRCSALYNEQSKYNGVVESKCGARRFWNVKNVYKYISMLDQGMLPIAETELLTDEQRLIEMIMVGLRTDKGVDIKSFERLYSSARLYKDEIRYPSGGRFKVIFQTVLDQLEKNSWATTDEQRCTLTTEGRIFLDTITRWFVEVIDL